MTNFIRTTHEHSKQIFINLREEFSSTLSVLFAVMVSRSENVSVPIYKKQMTKCTERDLSIVHAHD